LETKEGFKIEPYLIFKHTKWKRGNACPYGEKYKSIDVVGASMSKKEGQ
jgi:hypothetical protein